MKRLVVYFALIIPVCGFVISALNCCSANKNTEGVVIMLKDPGDMDFRVSDYFQVDKRVYVSSEGEFFLALVTDAYVTEKYAFLWDVQQRISKVDLSTGEIVSQLNRRGRGPEEYLFAMGIAGDDKHIYLMDNNNGRSIHVYDHDLKHLYKFHLDWSTSPSTFISTGNGFVFHNGMENDSLGKFVFTDNQGHVTNTFLGLEKEIPVPDYDGDAIFSVVHTEELFIPDFQGNILCFNPDSQEAYLYDGNSMKKQFLIKMDDAMPDQPAPSIGKIFSPNGKILVNYFYNKRGAYNRFGNFALFDKDYNLIAQGVGGLKDNEAPFLPILQKGNQLITVVNTDDTVGAVLPGRSIQAQIVFHSLK